MTSSSVFQKDAIFVVLQLHEKYLAVNKILYIVFVDLEKAFNCVPRKVIWWVRKLGAEQRVVRLVHVMYPTREVQSL